MGYWHSINRPKQLKWSICGVVCMFLATSQYALTELWGGGVQPHALVIPGLGSLHPPKYISNPPYVKYAFQWRDKTNKGQTMRTYIGQHCGKLALGDFFQPKMSHMLLFSSMYLKPFICHRNSKTILNQ